MSRNRKRRAERRERGERALRAGRSRPPAPRARETRWAGELIRYAIVCTVLLSVATPLGVVVAFFWGLSLLRRFQASREESGLPPLPGRSERDERRFPRGAPELGPVRLAEILERECAARAARFAERGVEVRREVEGEGALRGDADRLGFALGDLLDAALSKLEAGSKPRLEIGLGENLAGSEVWLRLRGAPGGPDAARAAEPAPLRWKALAAPERVLRAQGGRLEAWAETAGFELLATLPKAAAERP